MTDETRHVHVLLKTPSNHSNKRREPYIYTLPPPLLTSNQKRRIAHATTNRCKHSRRFYASSSTSSTLPYLDTEHIFEQGAACEYTSDKNNAFLSRVPIRRRTFRNELFLTGKLRHRRSYFLPIDTDTWDRTCSPERTASNADSKEVSSGESQAHAMILS